MTNDELEKQIEHVKHNLKFFVVLYDQLLKDGYPNWKIEKQIDTLLDKLNELLKKRKG